MTEPNSRAAPGRMRPRRLVVPDPLAPRHVAAGAEAVVVGGGIAGISAAVVLAERGVAVTVLEGADHFLPWNATAAVRDAIARAGDMTC